MSPLRYTHAQVISNQNFETVDGSSSTSFKQWNISGQLDAIVADTNIPYEGKYSAKLMRSEVSGNGEINQRFSFRPHNLAKYKITYALKVKNLKGKTGIGVRVFDDLANTICGNYAFSTVKDQDWKEVSGEFYADERAVKAKLFCVIEGKGEVWMDHITIEEIPLVSKPLNKKVEAYVQQYFDYVFKYSIIRDTAYLSLLKRNTIWLCAGHDDLAYCQQILKRYTTLKLNDGHSFFSTTADWKDMQKGSKQSSAKGLLNFPSGYMTKNQVAYLHVPAFATLDHQIIEQYIDSMQSVMQQLDLMNPKGWILDIADNQGGNSFAMLAGLGPLLGNGVCGFSQSADGSMRTRAYYSGKIGWQPNLEQYQKRGLIQLNHKDLPIAVIYGKQTGSAGEVVAISFRGLPQSKSFGQPTAGATTRVDNLPMSDGASLNLACGWDVDRMGVVYQHGVTPDVPTISYEAALEEAGKWILGIQK